MCVCVCVCVFVCACVRVYVCACVRVRVCVNIVYNKIQFGMVEALPLKPAVQGHAGNVLTFTETSLGERGSLRAPTERRVMHCSATGVYRCTVTLSNTPRGMPACSGLHIVWPTSVALYKHENHFSISVALCKLVSVSE